MLFTAYGFGGMIKVAVRSGRRLRPQCHLEQAFSG